MTADGWVRWYYATKDSFGAPALDYVDSTGRVYAKTCSKCRGRVRHSTKDGGWVCGHCGTSWKHWDRYLLKGEVQKSLRPFGFDDPHARYFDVARLMHRFQSLHEWDARLYVAYAMGHSLRYLSQYFPMAFPEAPGPFSKDSVHRRVSEARDTWASMLRTAGVRVTE